MSHSELVRCSRYVEVDGILVDRGYHIMVSGRTIDSDEQFIALARKRESQYPRERGPLKLSSTPTLKQDCATAQAGPSVDSGKADGFLFEETP